MPEPLLKLLAHSVAHCCPTPCVLKNRLPRIEPRSGRLVALRGERWLAASRHPSSHTRNHVIVRPPTAEAGSSFVADSRNRADVSRWQLGIDGATEAQCCGKLVDGTGIQPWDHQVLRRVSRLDLELPETRLPSHRPG